MQVMPLEEVHAALTGERPKLQSWYNKLPKQAGSKQPDLTSWLSALDALNLFGSFSFPRTSDIVGDDRVHEVSHCRLSKQQAKLAFVFSQRSDASDTDQVNLDFHELTECIARCAIRTHAVRVHTRTRMRACVHAVRVCVHACVRACA